MKCSSHIEMDAVAQCGNCGVGLCSECVEISEYRIDNKPMCRACNHTAVQELIAENKAKKRKSIIYLTVNAIFMVLGLIAFFGGGSLGAGIMLFAVGGLPTAWKFSRRTEREKLNDKIDGAIADVKYGEGSGLFLSIFSFIFRVVLAFIIGAIAAPVLLIMNIVKINKANKAILENEEILAKFI